MNAERPDPPVMLEVVEVSSRSVRLTWKRPFDGNSPVLGYLVQYQPLGTGYNEWDHSMAMNLSIPVGSVGTERQVSNVYIVIHRSICFMLTSK